MKRPPQMNADARAVLVAAQLPDEEHARGFVRAHADVQGEQLKRGSKRLREMRLIEPGDSPLLTAEGEQLARRLQENEARLCEGIPFPEREWAIKLRGGRDTADVEDVWFATEFDGRAAFTNGALIIYGKPPSDNKLEKSYVTHERVRRVWDELSEGDQVQVRPVAYSEVVGWRRRTRLVWFSDGSALSAEIYRFIVARYELVSWTHRPERGERGGFKYALNAHFRGERIAAAMPYGQEPTETIQGLIAEANKKVVKAVAPIVQPAPLPAAARSTTGAQVVQLSLLDSLRPAA